MKLLEFEFKNILSYGNKLQSFKFKDSPALILVEGENGAGKSSIKEAITVGIYGKSAIRKTKDIPNWINQNAYTNVKFLTSAGEIISLSRGIDPNFSNIEIDGATFNLPDKRKVDEFIEEELTKLPFSVFCNTVSLSFDDFKSFVNLSKEDKRKIVDRIFGIDNLTQMRSIVKEDLKELTKESDILDRQIQKNRLILENSNRQLDEFTKKLNDDIQSKIDDAHNKKEQKSIELEEVNSKYSLLKDQLDVSKDSLGKIESEISQRRYTVGDLNKKLELYQKNRCPHCLNDLTTDTSVQTKEKIKEKIAQFTDEISPLSEKILEIKKNYRNLEEDQNSTRSQFYQIKSDVDHLDKSIKDLLSKNTNDESSSIQKIINTIGLELSKDEGELSEKREKQQLFNIVGDLLSDSGIKKHLIDKIIPTLNSRILDISQRLDFKFSFEFDADFDPIIRYLGMEVSPKSLSSGQQKKMNLIVLLAFIEIIKMKHSQLNVMFLDEIFSSLDKNNVYLAIQILREYANKYNMTIFVVSHESLPEEFFDTKIFVKSLNHFSEMEIIETSG